MIDAPSAVWSDIRRLDYEVLDSTNAKALALAREGETGPLWVTARTQRAGRGRRGRNWESPPGNLYATLLLTDPSPTAAAAQLAFVAALAVQDAASAVAQGADLGLSVKWPNDLLAHGHKFAGVLIESEVRGGGLTVAIGIGVNCVRHPLATQFPATDFATQGVTVSADEMFSALSHAAAARLAQWEAGEGFAAIRSDWMGRAQGIGEAVRVRVDGVELVGVFETLDPHGRLVLRREDGSRERIAAGDVFPLSSAGRD